MKPTIPESFKKHVTPISILAVISVLIWFIGPLIAIANHTPFAEPEQRLYVIAVMGLLWLLKYIFIDSAPQKPNAVPMTYSPDTQKKISSLQNRFQGAMDFLKKTNINKHGSNFGLANLPWFLIIGPANSGKTTLLANSNINYILSKQFKPENISQIPPSDSCDWWVTRDSVIVDVPSTYFVTRGKPVEKRLTVPLSTILWNNLLGLVQTTHTKEKLHGVVIALNIPELLKKPNSQTRTHLVQDLKRRIIDLKTQFGARIPIHIVITKCDLLPGFVEFFSESGSDELSQAWGITLPALQPNEKLLDVFGHRFNALVKRINKQLIWRLHQERNPFARPYIKDFPLHVERLKEALTNLLKALAMPDMNLQGVYLTSAAQNNTEENHTFTQSAASNVTHTTALQIMRAPAMPSKPYFIRQLLLQAILSSNDHAPLVIKSHQSFWQNRAIYAASAAAIIAAALLLGRDFQQSVQKAYAIQSDLARYQLYMQQPSQQGDRLVKALPLLDALQRAANSSNRKLSVFSNILSFYSNKSQQTANTVYHEALRTIVLTEVKNYLEKYLQSSSNKEPAHIYTTLEAYLMLTDPEHRQADFIASTVNHIIPESMNKQAMDELAGHINAALNENAHAVTLNDDLVARIRRQLTHLPNVELAMVILKNMDANDADSAVGLGTNTGTPAVFVSKAVESQIPNMYIANNYQKIVNGEIPTAATEAVNGNWVLGAIALNSNQAAIRNISAQLRNQFTSNYVDIWESLLANIQPNTPKNLLQTDEMILNLTSSESPLLQLLQTIKSNTSFAPINTASPKLQALNNLLAGASNGQASPLFQDFVVLKQLHGYLQTILSSNDLSKSAFQTAATRMMNNSQDPITAVHQLASQSPEPIKSWLHTIANQSWTFILQESGQHIEAAWQENVVPMYHSQIANRYPLVPNSTQEISLQDFSNFLGNQGTLSNFYQTYLKPFVFENNKQWAWRVYDNQRLPLASNILMYFQHLGLLQHTFFPNGDNKVFVEFTLLPMELDDKLGSFTININGQQVSYQKNGPRTPSILAWPGNNSIHNTTLSFVTPANELENNSLHGDWAWFRLVSKSTQTVNSKKELLLTFANNGRTAKYLLFTQGHVNPFLTQSLGRFDLPEDLLE